MKVEEGSECEMIIHSRKLSIARLIVEGPCAGMRKILHFLKDFCEIFFQKNNVPNFFKIFSFNLVK
jgi:hypothetical protein